LAAAVVPLSTAYSVTEAFGRQTGLDDTFREAPFFYCAYLGVLGLGAGLVLVPGAPLVRILFLTQVLNAVLLLPLLIALRALGRDPAVMGKLRNGPVGDALAVAALAIVAVSVIGLAVAVFL
ncbi:MAG TPA: divalent metal cation transporter, partial [Gaiellaceae bacterium]